MPGTIVDGMDPVAVFDATTEAATRARGGAGPSFIECKTYRYFNHHGVQTLGMKYRSDEEVDQWRARDPIPRHEALMARVGAMTLEEAEAARAEVGAEVEAAVEFAEQSPMPDPADLLTDVYSDAGDGRGPPASP